jgi:hypothetical protein
MEGGNDKGPLRALAGVTFYCTVQLVSVVLVINPHLVIISPTYKST